MKKQSNLGRLLSYAGSRKILSYLSWFFAAVSALIALVPFWYIWRILKEVIEVAPNFGKAVNITHYGWMAVLFAVAAVLVYITGLMCSHMAAFRIATNMRIEMTEHISKLPLGVIELLGSGTVWLSETPDKVSRGWDGACNRTETWVELKDRKSDKEFFYFNTHLDHKGKAAREEGVKLLIEKIHEIAGKKAPAIVGGDFNTPVDSPIFKPLTKYMVSARAKAATTDHKGTFNGFGSAPDTIVIDHLYYRGKLKCQLFATLDGNYGAPYISDHYPIAMVFTH